MNLEINLFTNTEIDFKSNTVKDSVKNIVKEIYKQCVFKNKYFVFTASKNTILEEVM